MYLQLHDIQLGYGKHTTLKYFSLVIPSGAMVAVTGDNGAGKSTLLKAIAGILKPISGRILTPTQSRTAYLAQQCDIDRNFPVTVQTLVKMGLWSSCGLWKNHRQYQQKIQEALEITGLKDLASRPLNTLSGGQLQRALFARIIVQDADIILLDEPFNGIDLTTQKDLISMIETWQSQGRSIFMAIHNPQIVQKHFPYTLHIEKGKGYFGATNAFINVEKKSFNAQELFKKRPVTLYAPVNDLEKAG